MILMKKLVFTAILMIITMQTGVHAQGWTMVDALAPSITNPGPMHEAGVVVSQMYIIRDNRFVVGSFRDKLKYRDVSATANGEAIFVLKIDDQGNPISLRTCSLGTGFASGTLIMDKYENIYVSGRVGPGIATDIGYTNVSDKNATVIIKLSNDASGDFAVQWIREIMQISREKDRTCEINAITIDDNGCLYLLARAGTQYNTTRFPIPIFNMPTDSISNAKTEIQKVRNIYAKIPLKYQTGEYAELHANKTKPKELSQLYYTFPDKSVWASNLYGMWFATAMLLSPSYNTDSLAKYDIETLCGNHPDMMKWVNTKIRYEHNVNDSIEKYDNLYRKTYGSTITVGDSTYFTPINFAKIVMCLDGNNGNIKWSNGFPAILEQYRYSNKGCFYMRPVQWAISGVLRDALYFDASLFIVGVNDGYIADGKSYKAMRPYSSNGELNMLANPGSDLILMRVNAQTGRIEWAQTGGGRGGEDTYMKIARHDNYIFALGKVDPGKSDILTDAIGGTAARDGIMLDSIVNMAPALITSQTTDKKLSSRFAINDTIGAIFAKYNTEGRLLEKKYLPGINVPTDCEVNGEKAIVAMTSKIEAGKKIGFNTDSITYEQGGIAVLIYDMNGNPIKMLTLRDSLYTSSSAKLFIDNDDNVYIGGRSFSSEVVFNDTIHVPNKNYHDRSYYEASQYLDAYKPLSGRSEFYVYHGGHSGYLAKASTGFSPAFTHIQHVKCNGESNGELKVEPFFKSEEKCYYKWEKIGEPDYKFTHVPMGMKTPENIDSSAVFELPAGDYRVTVRNGNIERILTKKILQPEPIELNEDVSDTKWCEDTGEISLNVTGGSGEYTYFWEQWSDSAYIQPNQMNSPKLTQLGKGAYFITVTDTKGCPKQKQFKIKVLGDEGIKNKITNSNLTWDYANNKLTLSTSEVGTIESCNWINENKSGSFQEISSNTQVFEANSLVAGQYTIYIAFKDGCTKKLIENLSNPTEFNVKAIVHNHINCNGNSVGELELIPENKNGTEYIYKWEHNGEPLNPIPTLDGNGKYKNLRGGLHTITYIHDGGYYTITAKIDEPEKLEVVLHKKDVTCAEKRDGEISVEVIGGTEPYKYIWEDGYKYQTRNELDAQTAIEDVKYAYESVYRVQVADKNGCTAHGETTIRKPKIISAQITPTQLSCAGYNDGRLEISNITGGNGYAYHIWSNTLMAPEIHGLRDGQYYVTVYDSLGCEKRIQNNNLQLARPYETSIKDEIEPPTCAEIADGSIRIEPYKIGQTEFKYKWGGALPANTIDTLPILRDVPAGIYEVTVIDKTDKCEKRAIYELRAQNKAPQVNIMLSDREICDGERLQIYVDKDGSSLYDYYANDEIQAQSIPAKYSEITNVYKDTLDVAFSEAGEYTLSVIDYSETNEAGKRCQGKATAYLTVKRTPSAEIEADSALAWCPGANIKLNLSVADQPNTTMVWTRGNDTLSTDRTLSIDNVLGTGKYTLHTVSDGCSSKDSVEVARLDEETMKLEVLPTDPSQGVQLSDTLWCYGLGHIATLSASRHDAFSYLWFRNGDTLLLGNGNKLESPELMTNIPGKYHIQAIFGGCDVTTDTIKIGPRPRIDLNLVKDTTIFAGAPYIIDLGENAAIQSYNWTEKDGQNTLSSTHYMEIDTRYAQDGEVRDYKVSVLDTNACPATAYTRVRIQRVATQTTGLTDTSVEPLTLYPNPTHNDLYVEPPATDRQLTLYGTGGQMVHQQPINGKTWVDTSRLPAGLYIVRTETAVAKVVVE